MTLLQAKALAGTQIASPSTSDRVLRSFAVRTEAAGHDAFTPAPGQFDNGDEARYADKSGTYTKGILQTDVGLVDLAAYETFKRALNSGDPADFEAITIGGSKTLNGPQGGLAFDLECLDSSQFMSPPAPAVSSEAYAAELVELYWAALLRDVAFADYPSNPLAMQAADELTSLLPKFPFPVDAVTKKVTPQMLFRGGFRDEEKGPYISQFLLKGTVMGALTIDQKYTTLMANKDYMLDPGTFLKVQNGKPTGEKLIPGEQLYLHDGRGLAAYTHDDVLYQAYLMAYLVLHAIGGGDPRPFNPQSANLNPGNPYYKKSKIQNGFGTFGQPDIASTLAAVASEALKAVWYQKWYVHLRHRPESGGALVHLIKTGMGNKIQAHPTDTVLSSKAVKASFDKYKTYLLPQAFPEGSPTHPAYPTGHGAVAGACITVLKFFFDGEFEIPDPKVPSSDGKSLLPYNGKLKVNGELNKLAHNISFGHGIHAGIHWRTDTDASLLLGEAVALSVLRNRAHTYNEKFTAALQKLDGSTAVITNE